MSDIRHAVVPDIGDSQSIPVVEVLVSVGDYVELNQGLITLESDKATLEIPATFSGRITELLVKVDDLLSQGSLIATLAVEEPEGVEEKSVKDADAATSNNKVTLSQSSVPALAPETMRSETAGATPYASPLVYRLAREQGVYLQQLTGSARQGRISEADLMQFVKSGSGSQQPSSMATRHLAPDTPPLPELDFSLFGETERQPLTRMQSIYAANQSRSWATIPHATHHDEADITELESMRVLWNKEHQKADVNVTLLAFLLKASAAALDAFPRLNASLDSAGNELILKHYLNIGFTVESPDGPVVPVIRDVGRKSVSQLAIEIDILSQKGREGALSSEEMSGSCFTLSTIDDIGGRAFTPIINAPELAILGVSSAHWQSPPNSATSESRLMLPLSLSYDTRVTDSRTAARFVTHLNSLLADIRRLLL